MHRNTHPSGVTATLLLQGRRMRDAVFEGYRDGFGEPAWDALLALYCAHSDGRVTLPIAKIVAETHAGEQRTLLFVQWLSSQDLVQQDGDEVSLTERGRTLMARYLNTLETPGAGRAV